MFIGHEHLVKDFKSLIKSGRLAHGYIFFGEPEVGKFYFAKHLANLLENGEWEIAKRPLQDVLILGEVSGGIDAMREIKNFLWQKPIFSSRRLAIINNAENLTPQAQNAILKITEEPPASATIIIVAAQLENLLPPLLSRMQKIYFGRLSNEEMREFIRILGRPAQFESNWTRFAQTSFGRPGRATRLLRDELTNKGEKYAESFFKSSGSNRSGLIKDFIEEQKENPELLDYFFESLILNLRRDPIKNAAILKSALHRLFLIKSYNTNKRLQLEAI